MLTSKIFDPAPSVNSPEFETSKSPLRDNAGPPVSGCIKKNPPPLITLAWLHRYELYLFGSRTKRRSAPSARILGGQGGSQTMPHKMDKL